MRAAIEDNPKYQPGAYVSFRGQLYQILHYEQTSIATGKLWASNSRTEEVLWLSAGETAEALLVQAAPVLDVPDVIAATALITVETV